jgi:hypothetical protein
MEDALLLSRWWLLLAAPACVVGLGLIVRQRAVPPAHNRVPEFARLPLVAEQDVDLEDTGPLSFVIDHPRFNNVQANAFKPFALAVSLENAAGRVVNADKSSCRERPGHQPHERRHCQPGVDRPGHYRVRVAGLAPTSRQWTASS